MNMQLSVLLIEDDRVDQIAFGHLVEEERLDYYYIIADSIRDARAILTTQPIDIIISDYSLGDGTALDILEDDYHKPLVVVTGAGNETLAVLAMKAGACDYLTKDTGRNYLKLLPHVVSNAIKRAATEREVRELFGERIRSEVLQAFIRDVSHDLRTPLTQLSTTTYLLDRFAKELMSLAEDPIANAIAIQQAAYQIALRSERLIHSREHLEQIIVGMLEMAEIDTITAFQMAPNDLNDLVNLAVEDYKDQAVQKMQMLVVLRHPESLPIKANAKELIAAFRYMIKNAIDYTPHGGIITVETSSANQEVTLSVIDTGIGIAEEHLTRIFERFYRVDQARTMSNAGAGLGLSIAKQLIELHKGRIEVTSIVGEGSTFKVFLPRASS
jgi:signal transduction histidine kinase